MKSPERKDPSSGKITYSWHVVELFHEGVTSAIFYAMHTNEHGSGVVATCQVEPWGSCERPFVSRFCVDPEFRRRGIGRGLIKFVMREALFRSMQSLAMWVHQKNVIAEAFYRSEGFLPFYQDGNNVFFARRLLATEGGGL